MRSRLRVQESQACAKRYERSQHQLQQKEAHNNPQIPMKPSNASTMPLLYNREQQKVGLFPCKLKMFQQHVKIEVTSKPEK
jgi:hypothetical protein